jgi:hypothetical protein
MGFSFDPPSDPRRVFIIVSSTTLALLSADLFLDLLRQDGGLNALGELYVGAKTIHTQILSDTAYSGYRTVNGADLPNQPLVTAWPEHPVVNAGSRRLAGFGGHLVFGALCFVGVAVGPLIVGVL